MTEMVHTLLFLVRSDQEELDSQMAHSCLKSLEKSDSNTVVIFNQGGWSNQYLEHYLSQFALHCIVIGTGENQGTVVGRQACFEYIFEQIEGVKWISELHLDMIFPPHWESPLLAYLRTHDQPLIGCGIVDHQGNMPFLDRTVSPPPQEMEAMQEYLKQLPCDEIVDGFTNPCIHNASILHQTGGYDHGFLTGAQAFEDDSMLLGYYYYYGTKANWRPQVSFQSVVYHHVAGQRLSISGNTAVNYHGLIRQYGAMGLKHLSQLHRSAWHIRFFTDRYVEMRADHKTP